MLEIKLSKDQHVAAKNKSIKTSHEKGKTKEEREREREKMWYRKKATTTKKTMYRRQPGRKRTEAKTKRRNATLKSVHVTLETH